MHDSTDIVAAINGCISLIEAGKGAEAIPVLRSLADRIESAFDEINDELESLDSELDNCRNELDECREEKQELELDKHDEALFF